MGNIFISASLHFKKEDEDEIAEIKLKNENSLHAILGGRTPGWALTQMAKKAVV